MLKRNGQAQLNFDVLLGTKMPDIAVIALFGGGVNPHYKRVLTNYYATNIDCHCCTCQTISYIFAQIVSVLNHLEKNVVYAHCNKLYSPIILLLSLLYH